MVVARCSAESRRVRELFQVERNRPCIWDSFERQVCGDMVFRDKLSGGNRSVRQKVRYGPAEDVAWRTGERSARDGSLWKDRS